MSWSILSTIICSTRYSSINGKLISLSSDLTCNTMILLFIIILMLMSCICSCLLTLALALFLSSLLVYRKFLLLYLIIVYISSFILIHASQTSCASRQWFSKAIILKNCGCCSRSNTLLTVLSLLIPILFYFQLLPTRGHLNVTLIFAAQLVTWNWRQVKWSRSSSRLLDL